MRVAYAWVVRKMGQGKVLEPYYPEKPLNSLKLSDMPGTEPARLRGTPCGRRCSRQAKCASGAAVP